VVTTVLALVVIVTVVIGLPVVVVPATVVAFEVVVAVVDIPHVVQLVNLSALKQVDTFCQSLQ
jgi:hypothetical protein